MALNINATFEEKMTCTFKNNMRNLANFHQSMFESIKMYELKIYKSDFILESNMAELN